MKKENKKLISVCLELTDKCKVGCPYCLLEEKAEEISKERILDIIQVLETYGVSRFTVGGGEPLDIPYVYEIGKFIRMHGHKVLLRTSACHPMDCRTVKESFDLVDISIDSHKKEILKVCKPHINSDIVCENIRNFSENNVDFRCNILITRYNYDDVLSTITWLKKNGAQDIRIQKLVPRGRAKGIFDNINISNEAYNVMLNKVFNKCKELNMYVEEVKSVNSKTLCIIKPNGELYVGTPTGILRIGNVFSENILDKACEMVYSNQKRIYGVDGYDGLKSN